jgi:hypothetical protein
LRQFWEDIRNRRHLEAYALFVVALALTVLNITGIVSTRAVNSFILASLAFLIYASTRTSPKPEASPDAILLDRERFTPFGEFIADASEVCIYAPLANNSIPRFAGDIRDRVLTRGGRVRVVVLDPSHVGAIQDQVTTSGADAASALNTTLSVLSRMQSWGDFEYRLLSANPGFTLLIADPRKQTGRLIVEFLGFKDSNVSNRMHIDIRRTESLHWFDYWVERYEAIWEHAHEP